MTAKLFRSPNSFICKSIHLHFFHFFSTKILTPSPQLYDVMVHKHKLSPHLASLAASHLPQFKIPKNVDSILSFLKQNSFTTAQLEKMVAYSPRILGFTTERMSLKLKVFRDLGISSEEIAKIMSSNPSVLHSSTANRIIPKLSLLEGLLGSNHEVARLVRRSSWVLSTDLENTLMPNVGIFNSCGIPMERILHFLYSRPRCFLVKPDIMRKSVDRVIQFGISPTSSMFMYAASVFTVTSEGVWEVKLQTFRDFGFSNDDIFTMFRKAPLVFAQTTKKIKNATELLLATGNYSISSIAAYPISLGCSIEKKLEPRLQILRLLQSRNLIDKWPSLSVVTALTDDRFFDRFVGPYNNDIGTECITKMYVEAKNRFLLQSTESVRKYAKKAEEWGVQPSSKMYIRAQRVIGSMSDEVLESKAQALRSLGLSEGEILKAFWKCPQVFAFSMNKMKEVKEILVSTGKYDVASIVGCSLSFGCSVENRYKPRLLVLDSLESKKLIKKWPSLATLCGASDESFFNRYVGPYIDEVGHLWRKQGDAPLPLT